MGIRGLLKLADGALIDTHLSEPSFKGKRIGIDSFNFILKHCLKQHGSENPKTVLQCCCDLNLLFKKHGIIPLFVFDGRPLPVKCSSKQRKQKKRINQDYNIKEDEKFTTATKQQASLKLDEFIESTLEYLRKERIDFIVAPFEADAQLASLCFEKVIDAVLTDDSDLIIYGCEHIIFKLDFEGYCRFYSRNGLAEALGEDITSFDFSGFVDMCILGGCDYLSHIPGIGIKSAKKILRFANSKKMSMCEVIPLFLRGDIQLSDTYIRTMTQEALDNYSIQFERARLTFQHQIVFLFSTQRINYLHPFCNNDQYKDVSFLGDLMEGINHLAYVWGNINPRRLDEQAVNSYNPTSTNCPVNSIWHPTFKLKPVNDILVLKLVDRHSKKNKNHDRFICNECECILGQNAISQHIEMMHNKSNCMKPREIKRN